MASPPSVVRALYAYDSQHSDDLQFSSGQLIHVSAVEGDDWYFGSYTDAAGTQQEGMFPMNFVEKYEPEIPTRPARSARPKSQMITSPPPARESAQDEPEEDAPPLPAASKPQPPHVDVPAASSQKEEVRSPPSATSQQTPITRAEPPSAPKPAPAEPAQSAATPTKAPPPVAPKSNAFKDRIAAFNKVEQAPLAPIGPVRQAPRNDYIKKPFVAPPPSKNAYIPPAQKVEPIHKPYIREEDPEIKQRQDDDRAAAEAAGLTGDAPTPATTAEETGEDEPKPLTLKERMALLQKEQEAQRARQADTVHKKKPPVKKPSESSERALAPEGEEEELDRVRSPATERQSLDMPRERPRVPSAQRQPREPMSPLPAAPEHEILSGGEEADQSAAGETTEDDTGTIGPDESDERPPPAPRAPAAPTKEPDVGDEEDTTEEGEEEEEVDEETLRRQQIRERMARLAGGPGAGGFNPFGAPMSAAAPMKKRSTREKRPTDEDTLSSPTQHQMIAIPGMSGAPPVTRRQEPESDVTQRIQQDREIVTEPEMDENEEPAPPPRRSTQQERGAAPPVPQGKIKRKAVLPKSGSFVNFFRTNSGPSAHKRSKSSPISGKPGGVESKQACSELRAHTSKQTYLKHLVSSIIYTCHTVQVLTIFVKVVPYRQRLRKSVPYPQFHLAKACDQHHARLQ